MNCSPIPVNDYPPEWDDEMENDNDLSMVDADDFVTERLDNGELSERILDLVEAIKLNDGSEELLCEKLREYIYDELVKVAS